MLALMNRRIDGPASARIKIDGREHINFFGSGYLALAKLPQLRNAALDVINSGMAFSSQIPSALGGIEPVFKEVEGLAASAIGTEASIYFASGYMIGLVGLASIAQSFSLIMLDERAHYCLKDGAKLAELPVHVFPHCDADALASELRRPVHRKKRPLVVTDGAFPTTGGVPPLNEYATAITPYDGRLFIDESHSFGVIGEMGRGSAEYCGVQPLAIRGATLSKAFCAQGAFLGCSGDALASLRDLPAIRGACAGSPVSAAVSAASLRYVAAHPELRQQLRHLIDYFRTRLREAGVDVIDSPAPIVSFRFGTRRDMQALQARMLERGILIYHSTYIGAGDEGMIRCAVFRDHSEADIDLLVEAL
jgi:7-keto-8-aminopelargonate synthetase-like enzyme